MRFVVSIRCCNCNGYMELTEKGNSFERLECPSCKQPIPDEDVKAIKNTFDGLKALKSTISKERETLFLLGLELKQ